MDFDYEVERDKFGRLIRNVCVIPDADLSENNIIEDKDNTNFSDDSDSIDEDDIPLNKLYKNQWKKQKGPLIELSIHKNEKNKKLCNPIDYFNCFWTYDMFEETVKQSNFLCYTMWFNDRFEDIKKYLHFANNAQLVTDKNNPKFDRSYKISNILEMFRNACLTSPPTQINSVDEQIIRFKGKTGMKQYLPKKPTKWRLKVFFRN
ncbi:hypothetical protein A3Q56_03885 [Intoshia linei]|uniref:PiggyBac transposable element-derived protein domain-containing protein n=1 Tax=Intoshia linei TaxID=1819745 RepID=A0A177B2L1_9BILA|nr:hypothetical protein A3Q56_03885 [Intoshia linei]